MEAIDQQVINDNKDIYAKIQAELWKAESEIVLATGWFTDEDLFNILSAKLDQGVHIEIIIADNQENEKLDFNQLVSKGAAVYKIKSSGYGIMNQKFCVIDKKIALHGSYNWTVNAKKNNHESIISTNHKETISSLISNFNSVKEGIQIPKASSTYNSVSSKSYADKLKGTPIETQHTTNTAFEQILDSMIAAEIGDFDRKMLRQQGFDRCSANNGDHQVLYKAFDTLYSVFINDIDVIDDKKKRLVSKIEEFRVRHQEGLERDCNLQVDFMERECSLIQTNLEAKRAKNETDIEVALKGINDVKENKIPALEALNLDMKEQIKVAEQDHVRPAFKWFEFIPVAVVTAALLVYVFIFYSSAAYILLFSVEDARAVVAQNIPTATVQIFNPDAVISAVGKKGTAAWFIFLFVFIPLAFATVDNLVPRKWAGWSFILSFLGGVILLDMAIAYKVTNAIYEVNFLRGDVNEPWRAIMAFSDMNFYLVFVFGAFGLFLFKLAFKKFLGIFEERSPDILAQKNKLLITNLQESMSANSDKVLAFKNEVIAIEKNIILLKGDTKNIELELAGLPIILNQNVQKKKQQLIRDVGAIDKIAIIYTTHVLADNMPVSVDALKDRINVFLEGWTDFLHKEYAVAKATLKTSQAVEVASVWQAEKLSIRGIDKRVKVSQDE